MFKSLHPNYIKSSNLIFGTVGLGVINLFLSSDILNSGKNIAIAVLTLIIIIGLGYIVRLGKSWIKYLLLVFTILGLISIPATINKLSQSYILGIINIAQTLMQAFAVFILFRIPKPSRKTDLNSL